MACPHAAGPAFLNPEVLESSQAAATLYRRISSSYSIWAFLFMASFRSLTSSISVTSWIRVTSSIALARSSWGFWSLFSVSGSFVWNPPLSVKWHLSHLFYYYNGRIIQTSSNRIQTTYIINSLYLGLLLILSGVCYACNGKWGWWGKGQNSQVQRGRQGECFCP